MICDWKPGTQARLRRALGLPTASGHMPLSGLRYRSSARLHDSTRFPSRALRRITLTVLRTSGLLLLLLFIAASVLASLSDLALQFITSGRASLISDVSITFGSYVFVVSAHASRSLLR